MSMPNAFLAFLRRLPAIWREQRWLVLGSGAAILIIMLLISLWLPRPVVEPIVLQKAAENSLRPGDSLAALFKTRGMAEPVRTSGNIMEYHYPSQKNPNLTAKFIVEKERIIEIYYPITLEEEIKQTNSAWLPSNDYQDYWDTVDSGNKVRVYAATGLAITYQGVTKSLSGMYVFLPEATAAFLARHAELAIAKPGQDYSQVKTPEQYQPDVFATNLPTATSRPEGK